MLEARGITKVYFNGAKELQVLKDIHLTVQKGEVLSIVGPSGAGKSTLLHICAGLDEPTRGKVILDDMCLSSLDDTRRAMVRNVRFGFVFQFYHLLAEFSALENVIMPALLKKGAKSLKVLEARAKELLDFLGLSQRMHHRPNQLSGGEQQRVAIGRGLMNDPEILFCDEPTGNLDYATGRQILDMLLGLNRDRKMTIVMVTHSFELTQGSHRVLRILDGKMEE